MRWKITIKGMDEFGAGHRSELANRPTHVSHENKGMAEVFTAICLTPSPPGCATPTSSAGARPIAPEMGSLLHANLGSHFVAD
jgi:hypothetical protein